MKLGPKEIKVVNEYFVRPVKNRLKEIFMKKGLPQLRTADEIKQPPVRKDVEDIQAINEFMKRNPKANGGRAEFDAGGQAKLLSYVESLPKGSTVTRKLLKDYVAKTKIQANVENFFNRNIKKAKNIKDITVDTSAPKFYSTKPQKEGSNIKTSSAEISKFLEKSKSGSTIDIKKYMDKNNITTKNDKSVTTTNFKRLLKKFPEKKFQVITAQEAYEKKGFGSKPLTKEQDKIAKEVYKEEIKKYDSYDDWKKDPKNMYKVSSVRTGETTLKSKPTGKTRFDTDRIIVRQDGTPDFPNKTMQTKFEKDIKKLYSKPKGQGLLKKDFVEKYPVTNKQLDKIFPYYKKRDNLEYPKSTRVKGYKTEKQRYGDVTDLTVQEQISEKIKRPLLRERKIVSKEGKGLIDFAHRISKDHANALGIQFGTQNTGFDSRLINEVVIKPSEIRLDKFYERQRDILDQIKTQGVNKELAEEMNTLNKLINKEVKKTSGRLIGVNIDPNTQEISFKGRKKEFKLSNINKTFKELKEIPSKDRINFIRKGVAQSIDAEIKRGFRPADFKEILGDPKNRETLLRYAKKYSPDILNKFKKILDDPTSTRTIPLYANPLFSPGILKEAFKTIPTPAGAVALNLGLGVDPTSAIDRAGIAAEAAFAPALVKQAAKFGPVAQRFFNLGLSPTMAMRAARIASPLGIASLAAEGLYQGGKFTKRRIDELRSMTPEQREELRRQGEAQAFDPFMAAKGGRAGFESGTIPGGYTDDAYAYLREIDDEIFNSYKKYKAGGGKMKYGQYAYNAKRQMFGPFGVGVGRLKRAGGGLLKQAGDRSGAPPERGPNPQGLPGLLKRVKKQ